MIRNILWDNILRAVTFTSLIAMLGACTDDFGDGPAVSDDMIHFKVAEVGSRASVDAAPNVSSFSMLSSPDCPDTLFLYSQVKDLPAPRMKSRGSLTPAIEDFYMSCSRSDGSDFLGYYFQNEEYGSDGLATSGKEYYWMNTGSQDYRFYGMAPASGFGSTYTVAYDGENQAPRISYTVPSDPSRQLDLLAVTTEAYPDSYKQVVPLQFKHLCTAITFRADDAVFPGIIKKITIEGVKNSGVYDMSSCEWTLSDATTSYVLSPNKVVNDDDIEITPDGEATFFLLPQEFGEGARIVVEYENTVNHAAYSLSANLSGTSWPMGKVITYVVSTSGITATQRGLKIVGTADNTLLPGKISLKSLNSNEEILPSPQSITTPGFTIQPSTFIDKLIDKGLTGKQYYTVTISSDANPSHTQELMLEYEFDYMAFTANITDTSLPVPIPVGEGTSGVYVGSGNEISFQPDTHPSTFMVRWDPGDYSDEYTQVDDATRTKTYATEGQRQIRIYSNLKGTTALPDYNHKNGSNFPASTISVDTKLLSAPNYTLAYLFNNCRQLVSVPASLFENLSHVTNVPYLFQNCRELPALPEGIFDHFENVTDFTRICQFCYKLASIPDNLFYKCVEAKTMVGIFAHCRVLPSIPTGFFDHNPKVTDFSNVFQNCYLITSIPEELFYNCPDVEKFGNAFNNCKALTSVPAKLFEKNTKVTHYNNLFQASGLQTVPGKLFSKSSLVQDFSSAFDQCKSLTSVPADLFEGCPNAEIFSSCFSQCTNLTSVPTNLFQPCTNATNFDGVFKASGLTEFPDGIFDNMTKATTVAEAFSQCKSITSLIPEDLFKDLVKVTDFSGVFNLCGGVPGGIPVGLFANCSKAKNMSKAFYNCYRITSIPANLFANCPNINNLSETFAYCTLVQGNVPTLWVSYPSASHAGCFCRVGWPSTEPQSYVSNYDNIPEGWKDVVTVLSD